MTESEQVALLHWADANPRITPTDIAQRFEISLRQAKHWHAWYTGVIDAWRFSA